MKQCIAHTLDQLNQLSQLSKGRPSLPFSDLNVGDSFLYCVFYFQRHRDVSFITLPDLITEWKRDPVNFVAWPNIFKGIVTHKETANEFHRLIAKTENKSTYTLYKTVSVSADIDTYQNADTFQWAFRRPDFLPTYGYDLDYAFYHLNQCDGLYQRINPVLLWELNAVLEKMLHPSDMFKAKIQDMLLDLRLRLKKEKGE